MKHKTTLRKSIAITIVCAVAAYQALAGIHVAHAASLTNIRDTLSTSAPGLPANHTIEFTSTTTIPISGHIVFTPEDGQFTIPAGLDYTDIDLIIDNTNIPLAASSGTGAGSAIGVSVTSGIHGFIELTLNDTDTIGAGSTILIRIGSNAVIGSAGDQQITNPGSIGSYNETIETTTAGNSIIDSSTIQVALVEPVGIDGSVIANNPPPPPPAPTGGGGGYSPPYIPPPTPTGIDGATGGTVAALCGNSAYITITIPSGTWVGYANVVLSCIPFSTFTAPNKPEGPAMADTLFGISITLANGVPITQLLKPVLAVLHYTQGHSANLTSPFISAFYTSTTGWSSPNIEDRNNHTEFHTSLNKTGLIAILGKKLLKPCESVPADLNCDQKVNITDFSILMYYWQKQGSGIKADINKDGIVNLVDLSIMFYWWTG